MTRSKRVKDEAFSCDDYESADAIHGVAPDYQQEYPFAGPEAKRCNCRKARCLKLYCVCFSAGVYCSSCACRDCLNSLDNAALVHAERSKKLAASPGAFEPKVEQKADGELACHKKGCRCRRSRCIKKYCECYDAQVFCSAACRCESCLNQPKGGSATQSAVPHIAPANATRGSWAWDLGPPRLPPTGSGSGASAAAAVAAAAAAAAAAASLMEARFPGAAAAGAPSTSLSDMDAELRAWDPAHAVLAGTHHMADGVAAAGGDAGGLLSSALSHGTSAGSFPAAAGGVGSAGGLGGSASGSYTLSAKPGSLLLPFPLDPYGFPPLSYLGATAAAGAVTGSAVRRGSAGVGSGSEGPSMDGQSAALPGAASAWLGYGSEERKPMAAPGSGAGPAGLKGPEEASATGRAARAPPYTADDHPAPAPPAVAQGGPNGKDAPPPLLSPSAFTSAMSQAALGSDNAAATDEAKSATTLDGGSPPHSGGAEAPPASTTAAADAAVGVGAQGSVVRGGSEDGGGGEQFCVGVEGRGREAAATRGSSTGSEDLTAPPGGRAGNGAEVVVGLEQTEVMTLVPSAAGGVVVEGVVMTSGAPRGLLVVDLQPSQLPPAVQCPGSDDGASAATVAGGDMERGAAAVDGVVKGGGRGGAGATAGADAAAAAGDGGDIGVTAPPAVRLTSPYDFVEETVLPCSLEALLGSPGLLLEEPGRAEELAAMMGLDAPQQLAARKAAHILKTLLQMAASAFRLAAAATTTTVVPDGNAAHRDPTLPQYNTVLALPKSRRSPSVPAPSAGDCRSTPPPPATATSQPPHPHPQDNNLADMLLEPQPQPPQQPPPSLHLPHHQQTLLRVSAPQMPLWLAQSAPPPHEVLLTSRLPPAQSSITVPQQATTLGQAVPSDAGAGLNETVGASQQQQALGGSDIRRAAPDSSTVRQHAAAGTCIDPLIPTSQQQPISSRLLHLAPLQPWPLSSILSQQPVRSTATTGGGGGASGAVSYGGYGSGANGGGGGVMRLGHGSYRFSATGRLTGPEPSGLSGNQGAVEDGAVRMTIVSAASPGPSRRRVGEAAIRPSAAPEASYSHKGSRGGGHPRSNTHNAHHVYPHPHLPSLSTGAGGGANSRNHHDRNHCGASGGASQHATASGAGAASGLRRGSRLKRPNSLLMDMELDPDELGGEEKRQYHESGGFGVGPGAVYEHNGHRRHQSPALVCSYRNRHSQQGDYRGGTCTTTTDDPPSPKRSRLAGVGGGGRARGCAGRSSRRGADSAEGAGGGRHRRGSWRGSGGGAGDCEGDEESDGAGGWERCDVPLGSEASGGAQLHTLLMSPGTAAVLQHSNLQQLGGGGADRPRRPRGYGGGGWGLGGYWSQAEGSDDAGEVAAKGENGDEARGGACEDDEDDGDGASEMEAMQALYDLRTAAAVLSGT